MKKILYIFNILILLFAVSCQDSDSLMDRENLGDIYEDDVFDYAPYVEEFVYECYYQLPGRGYEWASNWNGAYLDCATDNGEARHPDSRANWINNGNFNGNTIPIGDTWAKNYAVIRNCNRIIQNYDKIPESEGIKQNKIDYFLAEAYALRAYVYFDLLRNFGGVPLIEEVLSLKSTELYGPRATFAQTVQFIVDDCEEAIRIFELPTTIDYNDTSDNFDSYGRVNQHVARAIKAKTLFYAASPLFNRPPTYSQYDNDANMELWRYRNYDKERWNTAALALKDVIDQNEYSLYTATNGTKTAYETYFTLRHTPTETILPALRLPSNIIYYNNLPFEFMIISGKTSPLAYNLPTYDLVKAYEMDNGMLIDQPGSGYRPLDMFTGRDPRLNSTIWHDESVFSDIRFETWKRNVNSKKLDGKDYINGYSRTGFYLRKYMDVNLNPSSSTAVLPNAYPIMRYADILLMYAEALNEYYDAPAQSADIANSIDEVRSRAGMPGLNQTFANRGWAMTQENVRKFLINERRIEFAFEEYRFWDVRRLMIGNETQTQVHELEIVLEDDDLTKTYRERLLENRRWDDRMNLFPIPDREINKNKNLIQNWGWTPAKL